MRFNDSDLIFMAQNRKSDLEGRLQHRSPHQAFRERFFKLVGNLLFYYRVSELSQIESQPLGVIVLENCSVRPDRNFSLPFAFELTFHDEPEKRHVFTTRTEHDMNNWIKIMGSSSYKHWKDLYDSLSTKLGNISGNNLEPELVKGGPADPTFGKVEGVEPDLIIL